MITAQPKRSPSRGSALLIAVLCWTTLAAGCSAVRGSVEGPANASAPPLRAGMPGSSPPFASEQEKQLVGLEPDLARELAHELGRGVTFERYEFEGLIPALRADKIDLIMAGMTVLPLRALRISFTHPYVTTGQRMLVRSGDAATLSSAQAIRSAGTRIGVLRSTTGEQYARAKLAPAPVRAYAELTDAVDDLADGNLDVVVCDAPVVSALAASRPAGTLVPIGPLLTEEQLAWAVRPGDAALRDQIDAALERMRADGRLDAIVKRWIPPVD